ncbi:MAG: hypothetical protein Kow002_00370 [Anaerolineales bacterium]
MLLFWTTACNTSTPTQTRDSHLARASLIPAEQVKTQPDADLCPQKSLSDEFLDPLSLPYPVNTRGPGALALESWRSKKVDGE